jgi:hypothetical protein
MMMMMMIIIIIIIITMMAAVIFRKMPTDLNDGIQNYGHPTGP